MGLHGMGWPRCCHRLPASALLEREPHALESPLALGDPCIEGIVLNTNP